MAFTFPSPAPPSRGAAGHRLPLPALALFLACGSPVGPPTGEGGGPSAEAIVHPVPASSASVGADAGGPATRSPVAGDDGAEGDERAPEAAGRPEAAPTPGGDHGGPRTAARIPGGSDEELPVASDSPPGTTDSEPRAPDGEPGAEGTRSRHPSGLGFDSWRRLELATDGLLLEGDVVIRRRKGRYRPPEGGAPREASLVLTRTTASAFLFFDLEVESTSEIDGETGGTREFVEVTPGEKAKLLRVGPERLELMRFEPPSGRREAPLREWRISQRDRWKRPGEEGRRPPLYDYYALFGGLGQLPLADVGDRAVVWLATTSGPLELEIRVEETRTTRRALIDLASGRERDVRLRELRLGLVPLGGEGEKVRGFLQMEGETEVWVEAESHTILEVRGRVPHVGLVSVFLKAIR